MTAVNTAVNKAVATYFSATLRQSAWLSCNDGGNNCFQDSRRLLGLGVQALARVLLSRGPSPETLVPPLCRGIRHGGNKRELLPTSATRSRSTASSPT